MHTTTLPYMGPTRPDTEPYPTAEYKTAQANKRARAESTSFDPYMCLMLKEETHAMLLKDEPRQMRRSKV